MSPLKNRVIIMNEFREVKYNFEHFTNNTSVADNLLKIMEEMANSTIESRLSIPSAEWTDYTSRTSCGDFVYGDLYSKPAWMQNLIENCVEQEECKRLLVYEGNEYVCFRVFVEDANIDVIDKYSDLLIDTIEKYGSLNCDLLVLPTECYDEEVKNAAKILIKY